MVTAPGAGAVPSPDAVIAEVYGGGGNSGATFTQDFIELANGGSTPVDLAGWSVQYLPANPSATSQWQVTALSGAVSTDRRYLVAQARGTGGTTELPTPDVTGTIAMSATAGTVALVTSTERLTCKTAADCAADSRIRDLVGYGTAVVRETSPAPSASNTNSVARVTMTDTDNNSVDFAAGEPTPAAGGGGGGTPPINARVHDIQGTTRLSPLDGEKVAGVSGVVTAVRAFGSARGFWLQDPEPDADPATSEGLFAFTGSTTPAVAPGDSVVVSGTVDEFYPDAPPTSSVHQSTTELTSPQWTVSSSGNPLPQAEVLAETTVPDTLGPNAGGNIEPLTLQPSQFALDFYESREGMRVQVNDARVVGATTAFNELFVTSKPNQNRTVRGGTLYAGYDQPNSGRLQVLSLIPFAQRPFPKANVGDRLAGATAGPMDYSRFGGYVLQATELGELVSGGLQRETTRAQRPFELAVATYNVENLSPADEPAKFQRLAEGLVRNLARPDIVALEEIQDNNGDEVNDEVVAADETLRLLSEAVVAAGGPRYAWRQIDPTDDADGGAPGGNIRVAFLFNPYRVSFVDRLGGDAVTPVDVAAGPNRKPRLTLSPGRIDPASDAWQNSRKPLAGEFRFLGQTVFVVANHFNSKGGDQPLEGRFQPPTRGSEVQRIKQADEVNEFVRKIQSFDRGANVVVLGDINDFPFSPAVAELTEDRTLVDLINRLPAPERYSYVFEGNSQTLDHVLVGGLHLVDYDVVHINAEFFDQASDHDPQVVRIIPWW